MIRMPLQSFEVVPPGAKAGLIIVHGIAEHGARYRHAAQAFAARNIASFVYDQRGHGESPGTRTHIRNFADFAADLRLIGEDVQQRFPELPLFVWGHSMGSVVVVLAARDLVWARGLITTGCAIDAMPKLDGVAGALLRIAAALAPRLRISLGIDASALTQVPEEQHRHMSDPLVPRTASLRLLYGFAAACRTCRANAPQITQPCLAVHGAADKVCPISGSRALIDTLGSTDKQLVTYPNLLHEVHNEDEPSRAALFDLMSRWMLERA
ncbi:MAG TPA: alpha/beta hydrolase [Xanthobacteraceae bacterium]|jgi:alpha-beta hydrolase superfamily lysophospholipase